MPRSGKMNSILGGLAANANRSGNRITRGNGLKGWYTDPDSGEVYFVDEGEYAQYQTDPIYTMSPDAAVPADDNTPDGAPAGDPQSHEEAENTGPTSHTEVPVFQPRPSTTRAAVPLQNAPQASYTAVNPNTLFSYGGAFYRYIAARDQYGQVYYAPQQVGGGGFLSSIFGPSVPGQQSTLQKMAIPAIIIAIGFAMRK